MAKSDVWFEIPPMRDDYQLAAVEGDYLTAAVRPKQFLHIDQSECILCEGCVDICPWKCIHYLSVDVIAEGANVDNPADDTENRGVFIVDEDECTRCALCVRPLPDRGDQPRQVRRLTRRARGRIHRRTVGVGYRATRLQERVRLRIADLNVNQESAREGTGGRR